MATPITANKFLFFFIALTMLCVSSAGVSFAESPPIPLSKQVSLDALEKKLALEKAQKDKIAKNAKAIEKELNATRDTLLKTARKVQNSEQDLSELETKIKDLEVKQTEIEAGLEGDKQSLSRLIIALERMRRMPPEVMIARPDNPLKTAQAGLLISEIVPVLNTRAESLKSRIQNLAATRSDLEERREKAGALALKLKAEHEKTKTLISKRETLFKKTRSDLEEREQAVLQIAAQAGNLKDLVRKLENNKGRERTRNAVRSAVLSNEKTKKAISTPRFKNGGVQLPVSGYITVGYKEPDNFGATSQGLKIETRERALVVAPISGIVRFAGEFKKYGRIVILEHDKGYHSLVAGLEKIDTVVGQNIASGEPVGTMGKNTNGRKPVLYYELRYQGSPIDPAKKFGKLS